MARQQQVNAPRLSSITLFATVLSSQERKRGDVPRTFATCIRGSKSPHTCTWKLVCRASVPKWNSRHLRPLNSAEGSPLVHVQETHTSRDYSLNLRSRCRHARSIAAVRYVTNNLRLERRYTLCLPVSGCSLLLVTSSCDCVFHVFL
jgi:hypothetical protein